MDNKKHKEVNGRLGIKMGVVERKNNDAFIRHNGTLKTIINGKLQSKRDRGNYRFKLTYTIKIWSGKS